MLESVDPIKATAPPPSAAILVAEVRTEVTFVEDTADVENPVTLIQPAIIFLMWATKHT